MWPRAGPAGSRHGSGPSASFSHCQRFRASRSRRPPDEVLDRRAEVERDLRRGTYVPIEARRVTFGEYYARWRSSRRISSTRQYTDDLRAARHVLPQWGEWAIADIRPSDIDDWIAHLSRAMGGHSVRHCYTLLRGPLRRAVKDRIIDDPCIEIALPRKPDLRKSFDDVLTREEVWRLIESVPDPSPTYAGLRTSERYTALVLMGCWWPS